MPAAATGTTPRTTSAVGLGLGVLSALAFAVTVVLGRSLARDDVGFPVSLGIPFTVGGVLLLAFAASRGRPLLPEKGERFWIGLLGAGIYALQSALFFSGLERGTAAAVTLLFYAYPAMVVIGETAVTRSLPRRSTGAAVALSLAGVALIVATRGDVDISRAGAAFSLAAGALFAVNLLVTERRVSRTDSMVAAAWLAIGTGVAQLAWGAVFGGMGGAADHWEALLSLGVDRAAAFAFMYGALRHLGSADTAVVLTFEALFATLMAAAFLDEGVALVQAVGGVAIIGAAVVIARQPAPPEAHPVDARLPAT